MRLKQRIVWIVGAEGIGKTHAGEKAALRLGVPHVQLDGFRWAAWKALQAGGALHGTPYGSCGAYEAARTQALRSLDDYLALARLVGTAMLDPLGAHLQDLREPLVLVECAAKYLPLLPQQGVRLHVWLDAQQHRRRLQQALSLRHEETYTLQRFLALVEATALRGGRVDLTLPLAELPQRLRALLAQASQDAKEPACSHS